jgi:hypothetical protein
MYAVYSPSGAYMGQYTFLDALAWSSAGYRVPALEERSGADD